MVLAFQIRQQECEDLPSYSEAIRDLPLEEKVTHKILAETSPESLKLS
ncbi:MAG TPA: hypothetical protein VFD87_20140 [Phototrophicaceae bacterium]|nr:hypothetical protein [Phototrophicaceae bacterium]